MKVTLYPKQWQHLSVVSLLQVRLKIAHSMQSASGTAFKLSSVVARGTVIPAGIVLADRTLGVPPAQTPPSVPKPIFDQIVPPGYIPGLFAFGEKKELPDWENLRQHVLSHSATELVPRAAHTPELQQVMREAVQTLLDMRRANGDYLIESLTSEEIWGSIFEMVTLHSGNPNPYHYDKRKARQTALELLPEFWGNELVTAFEAGYHWKYRRLQQRTGYEKTESQSRLFF